MTNSVMPPPEAQGTSTRPYLIRALHDWCTDNGFTPYLAVYVDASVKVPLEYVKNNEIVLNTSFDATSGLQLGNDFVSFKARFGGVPREIVVPIDHVIAIYARENGQGMAFPAPTDAATTAPTGPQPVAAAPAAEAATDGRPATPARAGGGGLRLATPPAAAEVPEPSAAPADEPPEPPEPPGGGSRPTLKRVK
ncbi:ClpXP protease specificity-enhancing factor [Rivibacter subsaxonicus]|uniref:Stringent starvation protein B n=1 Tax=Rivibacter subsaxonicus TaxID=457575 RepID=A0A4Q7VGN8_9BURK|nr:ClpXP protease specificity-enhancing factor [Rivibacter subsaxonicus]RZT95174.1 stringent starvation protein B [Rivibacter subsaxonicus]